ncbi:MULTISPECIES: MFS transporter [Halocynthiibacter]|uniref:MFS transporter n=1 Tax=Halocynthiibacter halioticoli TaxID=2986804 RepID=A0AAE3J080_9RHOB|nr:MULTISPECIES: MFS transporter [Halocynthiibacter]MCV6824138.1 MFS transporter [Halocynthiibacter halioticoli]MCW4057139.1 MFS transporter [Halocynthiibacter sp. SDUM655004]
MFQVLSSSWALLLGVMFLMVGNGLQGTLLGIRGGIEGYSTLWMSVIMTGYFIGFLGGSRLAPAMIRRVGHVRVFAALGSFISAIMILYPVVVDYPSGWFIGRVLIGFCFSGVYVTAESWLNDAADNENRGKALSIYMIVQMVGIVSAQALLAFGDPSGYTLFIIASVLVSISFAPILLSVVPIPAFERTEPLSLLELWRISPLGIVGIFLLGSVFAVQFGMSAVWGLQAGLSVREISVFVSMIYVGALVLQYPVGWLSDRMDRRVLIFAIAILGGGGALLGVLAGDYFPLLVLAGFMVGGTSNPLYALLIAYTNDYLEHDQMAAASGGMIFASGVGAIGGPLVLGWGMDFVGAGAYFGLLALLMLGVAGYALWRMSQRPAHQTDATGAYAPVFPQASPAAVEFAQEVAIEAALDEEDTQNRH